MESIDNSWKRVIQPQRKQYNLEQNLPLEIQVENNIMKRETFFIKTIDDQEILTCYLYSNPKKKIKNILIYLHSFHGNALEGKFLFDLFKDQYSILLYDLRGCGNNLSEYVSLGLRESIDLEKILIYIENNYEEINIFLWGRDMGAVSIIHYLHYLEIQKLAYNLQNDIKILNDLQGTERILKGNQIEILKKLIKQQKKNCFQNISLEIDDIQQNHNIYNLIKGIVYDSPYTSSRQMMQFQMSKNHNINSVFTSMAKLPLRLQIKSVIGYDAIGKNSPGKKTEIIRVPGFFIIGEDDELIKFKNFQEMVNEYSSDKKSLYLLLSTTHNDDRINSELQKPKEFLQLIYNKENPEKENQQEQQELEVDKNEYQTNQEVLDLLNFEKSEDEENQLEIDFDIQDLKKSKQYEYPIQLIYNVINYDFIQKKQIFKKQYIF